MPGFEEAQATYLQDSGKPFIGEVRRFGVDGPAYEVMGFTALGDAEIQVIETGERLDYALADVMADPLAETVP
ncbi:MAG: DUF5397 family protein [Hyphomicrobiaceae bacterium]